MFQKNIGSLSIWQFENLLKYGEIGHFISTRSGGFSASPYASLNLGLHAGDEPEKVLKNRKLLASSFGLSVEDFITSEQVHGGHTAVVTRKDINRKSVIRATDALVTDNRRICLMILMADCLSIFLYDPEHRAIGIAHSGWSGTVNKIAENTVRAMIKEYGSAPEDIIIGLGPSIGPCCYEIKLDAVEKIQDNLANDKEIILQRDNKYYLDLGKANKMQLLTSGIAEENIEMAGICTRCNEDIFFSARAHQGRTGRFGAGMMIRVGG